MDIVVKGRYCEESEVTHAFTGLSPYTVFFLLLLSLPLSIFLSISINQFVPKSQSSTDKPRITKTLLT